ncbi:GNAT family N-acetyltransferase [Azoarcus taiwanensis]|uniref:GNAT family N-acetyltransferase n=1 Tax=Azoarcus taiwanensis TaxID=666964 RepID=A0A972J7X3_9RHOO|nr:GNAT family N-acetyltransferase [Azoarcus taiwanensis]NMG02316.1 GNAT family N-acetyltransferase [Azoarcus taiwanensis]
MTATDNGVSMRPMVASDLEQIVRLDRTTGGEARTGFFERRLRAEQARPEGFFSCVAQSGDQVAGFILGHLLDGEFGVKGKVAVLDAIGVDPALRRRGLARTLLGEFDRSALARGASEMRTQAEWDQPGLVEFFSAADFRLAPRVVLERPTEFVSF